MPKMVNLKSGGRRGLSTAFNAIIRKAGLDAGKLKSAVRLVP